MTEEINVDGIIAANISATATGVIMPIRCVRLKRCRNPRPTSQEEIDKRKMNRIKKNDPVAITEMGKQLDKEGDHGKSLEYHTKAC